MHFQVKSILEQKGIYYYRNRWEKFKFPEAALWCGSRWEKWLCKPREGWRLCCVENCLCYNLETVSFKTHCRWKSDPRERKQSEPYLVLFPLKFRNRRWPAQDHRVETETSFVPRLPILNFSSLFCNLTLILNSILFAIQYLKSSAKLTTFLFLPKI